MKIIRFLAVVSATAMLTSAPALADKPGKNQGQNAHSLKHVPDKSSVNAHAQGERHRTQVLRDRNRNGIEDRDEALARNYGGALCPPGLAKKTPACLPPGQAKRLFREGQRISTSYRHYTPYRSIPVVLRDRYGLDDDYRYIYRNNVIYTVDPRTRLITSIINAVL